MYVNNVCGKKTQHFNCRIEQIALNVRVADVTWRWVAVGVGGVGGGGAYNVSHGAI